MAHANCNRLSWLLSTAVALALLGCASSVRPVPTPYPTSWPSFNSAKTADDCPNLNGTYSNQAAATYPTDIGERLTVSEIFAALHGDEFPAFRLPDTKIRKWHVPNSAESVSINLASETLKLTFVGKDHQTYIANFERFHFGAPWTRDEVQLWEMFDCSVADNVPRLYFHRFVQGPDWDSYFITLTTVADGSLVIRRLHRGRANADIDTWYRYPSATNSASKHSKEN